MKTTEAVDIVRDGLRTYADRGTIQGLGESTGRQGRTRFRFRWLLGSEFVLAVDPQRRTLMLEKLLPDMENRGYLDTELRRFVKGRIDPTLPAHRRLDPAQVTLRYINRRRQASLVMTLAGSDYGYAVQSLLGTLNDLFTHLQLYHIDYLHRNFGLPEE